MQPACVPGPVGLLVRGRAGDLRLTGLDSVRPRPCWPGPDDLHVTYKSPGVDLAPSALSSGTALAAGERTFLSGLRVDRT